MVFNYTITPFTAPIDYSNYFGPKKTIIIVVKREYIYICICIVILITILDTHTYIWTCIYAYIHTYINRHVGVVSLIRQSNGINAVPGQYERICSRPLLITGKGHQVRSPQKTNPIKITRMER